MISHAAFSHRHYCLFYYAFQPMILHRRGIRHFFEPVATSSPVISSPLSAAAAVLQHFRHFRRQLRSPFFQMPPAFRRYFGRMVQAFRFRQACIIAGFISHTVFSPPPWLSVVLDFLRAAAFFLHFIIDISILNTGYFHVFIDIFILPFSFILLQSFQLVLLYF